MKRLGWENVQIQIKSMEDTHKLDDFIGKVVWAFFMQGNSLGILEKNGNIYTIKSQINVEFGENAVRKINKIEASEQVNLARAIIIL